MKDTKKGTNRIIRKNTKRKYLGSYKWRNYER